MRIRDEREEDSRRSERDFVPEGALKDCTVENHFLSRNSSRKDGELSVFIHCLPCIEGTGDGLSEKPLFYVYSTLFVLCY